MKKFGMRMRVGLVIDLPGGSGVVIPDARTRNFLRMAIMHAPPRRRPAPPIFDERTAPRPRPRRFFGLGNR